MIQTSLNASKRWFAICSAIVLGVLLVTPRANAQLTAQDLLKDVVADVSPSKHADVQDAIKKFTLGDVIGARAHLELARQKDPTLPPADLLMAKMFILTGKSAAGRSTLEKLSLEFPKDPEPFLLYADQTLNTGGTIEADALYDKVLQLAERFNENPMRKRNFIIRARWGRAIIAERRKDWPTMSSELQALLSVDSHHAAAHYRLGVALCMQNKFNEGHASFQKAFAEDNKLPIPWLATALMCDRKNRQSDAQTAFERALNQDPKNEQTVGNYCQWLIKTGKLAEAETRLAQARKDHPDSLDLFTLSGVAARMLGKTAEAEQHFVTALGKAPAHITVMNQLATLLVGQSDEEKRQRAFQFAAMNSKLNPESADATITLAWVQYKLGKTADAMAIVRAGTQQGPLSPDSTYLVCEMISGDNSEGAKRLLKESLAADTPGIFIHRKEAQDLLKRLGG
jgi:Tfp pilus assembly protein PilF